MSLKALAFNSTLKRSGGEPSSTDRMLELIAAEMAKSGVETETIRLADHNILPGVTSDEGPGDDWPALRKKLLAADILILGTPICMGQPDSISRPRTHGRLPRRDRRPRADGVLWRRTSGRGQLVDDVSKFGGDVGPEIYIGAGHAVLPEISSSNECTRHNVRPGMSARSPYCSAEDQGGEFRWISVVARHARSLWFIITRLQSLDKLRHDAWLHHLRKPFDVPICETHAPMRASLPDQFRIRRTMDAVGWFGKINPNTSNRPIWTTG